MISEDKIVIFDSSVPQLRIKSFHRYRELPVVALHTGWQNEKGWLRNIDWDNRNRVPKGEADQKFVLVQYTLSGSAVFTSAAGEHNLVPGELFIIPVPSETSYYLPQKNTWEWIWLSASGRDLTAWAQDFTKKNGFIHRIVPEDRAIRKLASIYRNHVMDMDPGPGPEGISAAVYTFFAELSTSIHSSPNEYADAVQYAEKIIDKNFQNPVFNVSTLAEKCDLTREHFSRLFKEKSGISPGKAIEKKRMQHARELVWSCDLSVKEIAVACGYQHISHFCATFRKHFGTSPGRLLK